MAAETNRNLLEQAKPRINAMAATALTVALVALGATVALGLVVGTGPMFRSLLIGYMMPFGLAMGSLVLLMIQWCTAGYWGYVLRSPLEAGTRTLPVWGLVFALIALGGLTIFNLRPDYHPENHHEELKVVSSEKLWPWADHELVEHLPHHEKLVVDAKLGYLNVRFFAVRAAIAFSIWIVLALLLNRVARREEAEGTSQKLRDLAMQYSGPGIVIYSITMLFVSTDWSMSLQPIWYSSMFPVIFGFGQLLGALCLNALVYVMLRSGIEDLSTGRNKKLMRDLGSLILGFVVFWTYISFSQYLLIWSTNLKEEVPFFIARTNGGWEYVTAALVFGQFVIPFFVLLLRDVSRSGKWLARVAGFILVMRFIDLYWQMKPAFRPGDFNFFSLETVMDLAAGAGLFSLWLFVFLRQLVRFELLPVNDYRKATEPVHTVSDDVEIAGSHG